MGLLQNVYTPNGKFESSKIPLLIIAVVTISTLLGVLYSCISWYMPLLIVHVFFSILLGSFISLLFNQLIKICKIRNLKLAMISLSLMVMISLYFSWITWAGLIVNQGEIVNVGYINFRMSYPSLPVLSDFVLHPSHLLNKITTVYNNGIWTIGTKHSHGGEGTVKGFYLLIMWLLETLIIIYFSFKKNFNQVKLPFSDETNNWIPFQISNRLGYIDKSFNLQSIIEANHPALAEIMTPQKGTRSSYSQLILFGCSDTKKYLTIDNFEGTIGKNGRKVSFSKKEIIHQIEINDSTYAILNAYLK